MVAVQGFFAALAARWAGDQGPAQDGRATLNPLPHLDLMGLVGLLLFRAGWSKALDVDARTFRSRSGSVTALLVPVFALLLLGVIAIMLRATAFRLIAGNAAFTVASLLAASYEASVRSAVLALLPMPPLLGAHWLTAIRPELTPRLKSSGARLVGGLVVLVLLFTGVLEPILRWSTSAMRTLLGY